MNTTIAARADLTTDPRAMLRAEQQVLLEKRETLRLLLTKAEQRAVQLAHDLDTGRGAQRQHLLTQQAALHRERMTIQAELAANRTKLQIIVERDNELRQRAALDAQITGATVVDVLRQALALQKRQTRLLMVLVERFLEEDATDLLKVDAALLDNAQRATQSGVLDEGTTAPAPRIRKRKAS